MKSQHSAGSTLFSYPSTDPQKAATLPPLPPRDKRSLLQEGPLSTCDRPLNSSAETPSEAAFETCLFELDDL